MLNTLYQILRLLFFRFFIIQWIRSFFLQDKNKIIDAKDINKEFLETVLKNYYKLKVVNLKSFKASKDTELGATGSFFLELEYEKEEMDLPKKLFVKSQASPMMLLITLSLMGCFRAEALIYKSKDFNLNIRTPECLYSNYDEKSANYLILLKDESNEFKPMDQLKQYSLEENLKIIKNISKLHSKFFEKDDEIPSWLPTGRKNIKTNVFLFQQMAKKFPEKCKEFNISKRIIDFCGTTVKDNNLKFHDFFYHKVPQTVCHIDFRYDNILISKSKEIMSVDFQLMQLVGFSADLSIFVSFNLSPLNQDKFEDDILECYFKEMISYLGGEDKFMSFEQMKEYYYLNVFDVGVSALFLITQDLNSKEREKKIRSEMVKNQIHFIEKHFEKFEKLIQKYKIY